MLEDTIYAPSTPPINSPIAIIRISGSESLRVANLVFQSHGKIKPRLASFGTIIDNSEQIDDIILIYYHSPQSYTGEDMIEIFCHGNQIILYKIIRLLNRLGLRLAEPGEFTKRAFLNGKLDLTEAEAINHIITAQSEWEVDTAIKQMHGSLKNIISEIRDNVILLKADIEAGIDFIEEDIEFVSYPEALNRAEKIKESLNDLLLRCKTGEKISHGIDVTITGKPNVGKSSILNLILNQERAIVSDIPGTTRDLIRESIQINGIQINLTDTAGINTPGNEIEKIGIEFSHKTIEKASIILMVIDAATGIDETDRNIIKKISSKKNIIIINKIDLVGKNEIETIEKKIGRDAIHFSAITGIGLSDLKNAISTILSSEFVEYRNSFVADLRIINLLEKSIENIDSVSELFTQKEPVEIIAFEMQALHDNLSEITGEITPDNVLDSIFNRFCIGK